MSGVNRCLGKLVRGGQIDVGEVINRVAAAKAALNLKFTYVLLHTPYSWTYPLPASMNP